MKYSLPKKIIYSIIVAVLLVGLVLTAFFGLNGKGYGSTYDIDLGLDLAGGVSITYQIKEDNFTSQDVEDTIYKLQKRVEGKSTESQVYKEGDNRITVEIPGVKDANALLAELGTPGSIYFIAQTDADGNQNYSYDSTTGGYKLNYDLNDLIANGSVILQGSDVQHFHREMTTHHYLQVLM